jgi:enoyl-CoA hydratase
VPIRFEVLEPGIGLLLVNRPQVRNALNWEAMEAFSLMVEDLHARTDLRTVILSGAGRTFIAGGDLKQLHKNSGAADGLRLSRLMTNALMRLESLPFPIIAAINGPARGGGAEIALACDLRVLDAGADLGFVQISLGLTPGWGAGQRLLRMVGYSLALEYLAGGRVLTPLEAAACGLANRIAPPGEALTSALALAREISRYDPAAVQALKRLLRAGLVLPPEQAASAEQAEFPALWAADAHLQAVERFLQRKGE